MVGHTGIPQQHTADHLFFIHAQPGFQCIAFLYHTHHVTTVQCAGAFGDRHIFDVDGSQSAVQRIVCGDDQERGTVKKQRIIFGILLVSFIKTGKQIVPGTVRLFQMLQNARHLLPDQSPEFFQTVLHKNKRLESVPECVWGSVFL